MPNATRWWLACFSLTAFGMAANAHATAFITSTGSYPASIYGGNAGANPNGLRGNWASQNDYAGTVGHQFTVGANPLTVTALGYYDGPNSAAANTAGTFGDGLNNAHGVAIWSTTSTTALATVTVPSGTAGTLTGDFRYVSLGTPITLAANTVYIIGGQVTVADNTGGAGAGDVFRNDDGGETFGAGLTSNNGVGVEFSGPPSNPSFNDGVLRRPDSAGSGYAGANFIFTATPEPASLGLVTLTAAGALSRRRVKSRQG